jgi:hypothetical protein
MKLEHIHEEYFDFNCPLARFGDTTIDLRLTMNIETRSAYFVVVVNEGCDPQESPDYSIPWDIAAAMVTK